MVWGVGGKILHTRPRHSLDSSYTAFFGHRRRLMLRTLLRRSERERNRNVGNSRKKVISLVEENYVEKNESGRLLKVTSATKIQAMKRCVDAKKYTDAVRRRRGAALLIQKTWRGKVGKQLAQKKRKKLNNVVGTSYQMSELKERCKPINTIGDWQEYRDPDTNCIFFYHERSGSSQWDPPRGEETEDSINYFCTFEACQATFSDLMALEEHRNKCHGWKCHACFCTNRVGLFPKCGMCGNELGKSGRSRIIEYEQQWETPLFLPGPKETIVGKSNNAGLRSVLTELRPQSSVDRHFCRVRDLVLAELVSSSGETTKSPGRDISELEWPDIGAQRGPVSRFVFERNVRKKIEDDRRRKKVGQKLLRSGHCFTWRNQTEKRKLQRYKKRDDGSNKETKSLTRDRPVTPLMVSSLLGIRLHNLFEIMPKEENDGANLSKGISAVKLDASCCDPITHTDTEKFSNMRDHLSSADQSTLPPCKNIDEDISSDLNISCGTTGTSILPSIEEKSSHANVVVDLKGVRPRECTTVPNEIKLCNNIKDHGSKYYKMLIRTGLGTRQFSSGALYTGDLANGIMTGEGMMEYRNGDIYRGSWKNNLRNGHGSFTSHDGKNYVGSWKDGMRHGNGSLSHPNGDRYEGAWYYGKMTGNGVLTSANGDMYEGRWLNNKYHGVGKFSKPNGHKFIGVCVEGKVNGIGIILYATGATYKGYWKDNRRHGKGLAFFPNGSKYVGNWKNGKFNGHGKFIGVKGNVYAGDWFMGRRDGYGKALFSNGDIYIGSWKEDRVFGSGIMFYGQSGNLYEGTWANGLRHGTGSLKLKDGGKFEGNFKEGSIHGRGCFKYGNGDIYRGHFEHGCKHGKGVFIWKNGDTYVGQFCNDRLEGYGKMTYAAGHSYIGNWVYGKKEGQGKFNYADKNVYDGSWHEDQRHGQGKFIWNDAKAKQIEFYDGQWAHDCREGLGFYQYQNGSTYEGNWISGVREGHGVFQYADGTFYKGKFRRDKRSGYGIFQAVEGITYCGDWKNGNMHGFGALINASGNKYEGEFFEGRKHGDGAVFFEDGNVYTGQWKNGCRYGRGHFMYKTSGGDGREDTAAEPEAALSMEVYGC